MTKFLSDSWMYDKGFADEVVDPEVASQWWYSQKVTALPPRFPMTLLPTVSCGDAISILQKEGFDQMPVVDASGSIMGMVTESQLMVCHSLYFLANFNQVLF